MEKTPRKNVYSGTVWEEQVAYCRAKRVANMIFIAGTTSVDENGSVVGENDVFKQTLFSFQKAIKAMRELGGNVEHVVRTRMYVTDIDRFEEAAQAHKEVFHGVDPVATCVEITRLVNPDLLVEIEIDAIV